MNVQNFRYIGYYMWHIVKIVHLILYSEAFVYNLIRIRIRI